MHQQESTSTKRFLLSISALSAAGLFAFLPTSVSAQEMSEPTPAVELEAEDAEVTESEAATEDLNSDGMGLEDSEDMDSMEMDSEAEMEMDPEAGMEMDPEAGMEMDSIETDMMETDSMEMDSDEMDSDEMDSMETDVEMDAAETEMMETEVVAPAAPVSNPAPTAAPVSNPTPAATPAPTNNSPRALW